MKKLIFLFFSAFILPSALVCGIEIPLDKTKAESGGTQNISVGYADIERIFNEHPMTTRLREQFLKEAETRKKSITDIEDDVNRMNAVVVSSMSIVSKLKDEVSAAQNPPAAAEPEQQETLSSDTTSYQSTVVLSSSSILSYLKTGMPLVQSSTAAAAIQRSPEKTAPEVKTSTASLAAIEEKQKQIAEMEASIELVKKEMEVKQNDLCKFADTKRNELERMEAENTESVMKDIYHILDIIAKEEGISIVIDKSQILYGQNVRDLTDKVIDRLRGR